MPRQEEYDKLDELRAHAAEVLRVHGNGDTDLPELDAAITDVEQQKKRIVELAVEEADRIRELNKHRAFFSIPEEVLYDLFNVPKDVYIRNVDYDCMTRTFRVFVISERFEECPEDTEAPRLHSTQEVVDDEDGHTHIHLKLEFPPPIPNGANNA